MGRVRGQTVERKHISSSQGRSDRKTVEQDDGKNTEIACGGIPVLGIGGGNYQNQRTTKQPGRTHQGPKTQNAVGNATDDQCKTQQIKIFTVGPKANDTPQFGQNLTSSRLSCEQPGQIRIKLFPDDS